MVVTLTWSLAWACAGWATTYYVDSANGNDNNNGTSSSTAWRTLGKVNAITFQPGDKILLKAGSVWNDEQLFPKGSGADGSPIVVDSYGSGDKPLINCNGKYDAAIRLENQQYWEINNLEVTNSGGKGIYISGKDVGTLKHIHLSGLEVHDTGGSDENNGIHLNVEGDTTPTKFDDVLIEDCYIHDIPGNALTLWSSWGNSCTRENVVRHTNVVIRNNVIDHFERDGLQAFMSDGALVEYNVISRGPYSNAHAYAALWTWDELNAVYQYNEVYDSQQTKDGMGFDIDGCSANNVVQYNYFHDNDGGLLMIIGSPDCAIGNKSYVRKPFCHDNVFRYNISQNDKTRIWRIVGKIWDNYIYNNTVYLDDSNPKWLDAGSCGDPKQFPDSTYWYNNIHYNTKSPDASWNFSSSTNNVFDYNVFYGYHHSTEPNDPHKLTSDPKLVDPGSGGVGLDTVDGYKLQSDSPCIDSGKSIENCGNKDYWGNSVPAGNGTDRGAHEYQGTPAPVADFTGNPTSGAAPLTVDFTDASTNSPTSWSWDFGDDGNSTAQNPSHEYTSAGDYTVSLTATNAGGSDTETKTDYISVSQGSSWGPNLLSNPGFEDGNAHWTACSCRNTVVSSPVHSGSGAMKLTGNSAAIAGQDVKAVLQPNTTYKLSGWGKVDGSGNTPRIAIWGSNWSYKLNYTDESTYTYKEIIFTTPSTLGDQVVVEVAKNDASGFYADDISLQKQQ